MRKITLAILSIIMLACTPDRKREAQGDAPEKDIIQERTVESGPEVREKEPEITTTGESNEKPLVTAEQMPAFKGGEAALRKFLTDNLQYPEKAKEAGIRGRVIVRFVVTPTGALKDINVIRGIDPLCDKEAVRLIKSMPAWKPGKQNGKAVAVYFTLPVQFKL